MSDTDLDPADWADARRQGHQMLDDMLDHLQGLRAQPVWREPPAALRQGLREPLPLDPQPLAEVHQRFLADILPYGSGNTHPGFMGWVQGGGSVVGMLAEMLAAGLNANCGGRDHMALEVEQQVLAWTRQLFDFPQAANGLFLTGASQANFLAILMARRRRLGAGVRQDGVSGQGGPLTAYASAAAHGCIARGLDMAGLGTAALRLVPHDAAHRLDVAALAQMIAQDRAAGCRPFLVVGTAGTVDVGAIDPLNRLADLCADQDLHFHVDGALGALAMLSEGLAPRLQGLQRADSLAFDWHKLGQVPYEAGYLLVRDGELQRATFAADAAYLSRAPSGLAAGDWWPCDFGPDLSRGFKALKVWFAVKHFGARALGAMVDETCRLARLLAAQVDAEPELQRLAPVALNIVCFRYAGPDADRLNAQIVMALQHDGRVAPSLTRIDGQLAIRAAITNHRTTAEDIAALVSGALAAGRALATAQAA